MFVVFAACSTAPEGENKTDVVYVALNKDSLTLKINESETLTATVLPNNATVKSITWSSSDLSVAEVENEKVTAVGSGTATISADVHNGKSPNCEIMVEKRKPFNLALFL